MLGAGEGWVGTSSFKWKASRDHYVHPCWPEDENPTHLQHLRGLCCSSHPVPSSYSCICFPRSKLFLRQTEHQFPCMWVEQCERLLCFPSFTFCSQMVVPYPGKEQGWYLQGQGYAAFPLCPTLHLCAEPWMAPTGHSSCHSALAGKMFELHSLTQDRDERCLGIISLGNLELSHFSVHISVFRGVRWYRWLWSILAHHFTSPSDTGPKMGTRIWAHRGQAVTAVIALLCWYCWEWQGALPTLLQVWGANPQTTQRFRPWWQQHNTRGKKRTPGRKHELKGLQ